MTELELEKMKLEGSVDKLRDEADKKLGEITNLFSDFQLNISEVDYNNTMDRIKTLTAEVDKIMKEVYKIEKSINHLG